MQRYTVGIAGATGLVGQRLVQRMASHPWFTLGALGASERSAGRSYRDATRWMLAGPVPSNAADTRVGTCAPETFDSCDLVLSALDTPVAKDVEPALAGAGLAVVSNSSAYRMAGEVPLLIPEVNGRHVVRLAGRERRGFVVTNPNCSVTGLALALAPLHRAFGVRKVIVATMQAVSGAGLEGPRAIDMLDNVVPYIGGEEEKIEAELAKLLGAATADAFVPADLRVAAHCHRVPTVDGHLEAVSVELARPVTPEDAIAVMEEFRGDIAEAGLPTAPDPPLIVRREVDRPQTRLDRDAGGGMTVVVGRVRTCPVLTLRLVVLSHNMVRGAAGGATLNAEWLASQDLLPPEIPRVIVMKFGGTSVADAARILAAAEIVRSRLPRRPVVVVSALAGVTDLLARASAVAHDGTPEDLDPILADLARRHRWALSGSVSDPGRRHDLGLEVDALLEDLRQLLRSIRVLGEGTPRAADALLAFGEILSSRIVAAAFAERGLRVAQVDARRVMITDGRHGAAEPDPDEVAARGAELIAPRIAAGEIPVLGGFFGAAKDGRTTTLGRGGSDTSAAVLGSALHADEIEIWTDVDGVMTADPRRVPAARPCASVSFAEAAELAFYGAKVLHPASIAPAVRRGIPVRVLNSSHPERPGTLIMAAVADGAPALASVASRGGLASVRVASRSMRLDPGFLPRVLAAVDDEALVPDLVVSSEVAVTLVLPEAAASGGLPARLGTFAEIELRTGRGIVCVVGGGLALEGPTRGRVLAALATHDPELVALGGSATSVAALVPDARLDACVRALHREFFEGAAA